MAIENYASYLTHLCKCAIENSTSDIATQDIDFNAFCNFCQQHKLANIAYIALKNSGLDIHTIPAMAIFKEKYEQAIVNDTTQQYYLDLIIDNFKKNNIDYVLLKGAVLKKIYPSTDFRQIADMDIYINPKDAYKAKKLMENLGFKNTLFGIKDGTDNYNADKFSYIELHKQLTPGKYKWSEECNKITDRLIYKGNHEYIMSDEDFYIFMFCHIAKHLKCGGIGIRAILDIWIYLNTYKNLDWTLINDGLEKCELTLLHSKIIQLIDYWFNGYSPDKDIYLLSRYISSSGWNGFNMQALASTVDSMNITTNSALYAKIKCILATIFMSPKHLKSKYTILEKYPIMLPFCWIHRWFDVIIHRTDTISETLHKYDNLDINKAQEINTLRKSLGL